MVGWLVRRLVGKRKGRGGLGDGVLVFTGRSFGVWFLGLSFRDGKGGVQGVGAFGILGLGSLVFGSLYCWRVEGRGRWVFVAVCL